MELEKDRLHPFVTGKTLRSEEKAKSSPKHCKKLVVSEIQNLTKLKVIERDVSTDVSILIHFLHVMKLQKRTVSSTKKTGRTWEEL